jgi:hypothetical protein
MTTNMSVLISITAKPTHSVLVPSAVIFSKIGGVGTIVGKGVGEAVEVGVGRSVVFLNSSTGSRIMMAILNQVIVILR